MNILIVTANPKPNSHTEMIANSYQKVVLENGHTVKTIDVYASENLLSFTKGIRLAEGDPNIPIIKSAQESILWAEEIVFIHPIWWSNMPAGLKNWVDSVFTPGFAYKYENGRPVPLLTQKAKVFCTAGSYASYYTLPIIRLFTPLHLLWKYALLRFFGIDLIEFKVCDKMNVNNSCPPEGCFENFLRRIAFSAKFIH